MRYCFFAVVLLFATSCASGKRSGGKRSGTPTNKSAPTQAQQSKSTTDTQSKDARKKELETMTGPLSPSQEAELKVLKDPASTKRQADLVKKKYDGTLTDIQTTELKYLEKRVEGKGMSTEEARLKSELDNGVITSAGKTRLNEILNGKRVQATGDDTPKPDARHDAKPAVPAEDDDNGVI